MIEFEPRSVERLPLEQGRAGGQAEPGREGDAAPPDLDQPGAERLGVENPEVLQFIADCRKGGIYRKIKEVPYAMAMEFKYSKEDILTIYFNRAYLGAGARGFEAAVRYTYAVAGHVYQGHVVEGGPESELTRGEAAACRGVSCGASSARCDGSAAGSEGAARPRAHTTRRRCTSPTTSRSKPPTTPNGWRSPWRM